MKAIMLVMLAAMARAPVHAADFTILVGQNDRGATALAFNPAALSVSAGDTITFKNAGGLHNAHSVDPAFAFRCGNGSCTNANPDASLWTAPTLTVPASARGKTIQYQCDQHAGSGMVGEIVVGALPVTLQSFDVE